MDGLGAHHILHVSRIRVNKVVLLISVYIDRFVCEIVISVRGQAADKVMGLLSLQHAIKYKQTGEHCNCTGGRTYLAGGRRLQLERVTDGTTHSVARTASSSNSAIPNSALCSASTVQRDKSSLHLTLH
jgi:hypothetical protein